MLNEDGLDIDELVAIELPTAMRGYRQEDVDRLLDRVADALEQREILLRTMTEDRDALLGELQQAQSERDAALARVDEGGARARQAVDEARRLRERVQDRAQVLLDDAGRRADELRAQGRAEAAVAVTQAQAEARRIVGDAERRRDQYEHELRQRWAAIEGQLEAAARRGERARARLREELERHLEAIRTWEEAARSDEADVAATGQEAPAAMQPPPPAFPAEPTTDDEDAESSDDARPAAGLAEVIGWDPDEIADLESPFRLDDDDIS